MSNNKQEQLKQSERDGEPNETNTPPSSTSPIPNMEPSTSTSGSKKGSKKSKSAAEPQGPAPLNICRNKHWRFISSFHGPWLQLPVELLHTIANLNYNTPSPHPIDPAVLFDVYKVRQCIDEATALAVRAASDFSPMLSSNNRNFPPSSKNAFGPGGPGHGPKLSRERKFRMRELASQKLARAYRVDEIVCSVATMQCASPVEDVGCLVLQRNPQDSDAKYVHFFHEKIPSRQVVEWTSLQPLNEIISERPGEPEALRTRATVKNLKQDLEGAVQDLTHALTLSRFLQGQHKTSEKLVQSQEPQQSGRRPSDLILADEEQPSSLDRQLLFQRASLYLTMASKQVENGISPSSSSKDKLSNNGSVGAAHKCAEGKGPGHSTTPPDLSEEALKSQMESRKLVKTFAKRALRDFLSFISEFEYSPNMPTKISKDFHDRMNYLVHGIRSTRSNDAGSPIEPHTVYPISDLFSAVPPADIPPYPSQSVVRRHTSPSSEASDEWRTFHPLLAEALHSILLCHCLIQTSTKEIQRHAYMVARLVRLSDGFPLFQSSRSPARSDWLEIIRRAENWLQLSASWESLCAPSAATMNGPHFEPKKAIYFPDRTALAGSALATGEDVAAAEERRRKAIILDRAVRDSLGDDRVTDEASFRAAIQAREKRADADRKISANSGPGESAAVRSPAADDSKDYPILTERAAAIAQWILEAPAITGTTRRKKKSKRPAKADKADDICEGMSNIGLEDQAEM